MISLNESKNELTNRFYNMYNLHFFHTILIQKIPGHVPCQVFTKNRLKQVKYEKYKSISILYPIDYQ
jgi:hypothetical protein